MPDVGMKITVDAYIVNVDDRVGQTRNYKPPGDTPPSEEDIIFADAAAGQAKFFTNGYSTESSGIDIVIDHNIGIGEGNLHNSLSASFSKTDVTNVKSILGVPILDDRAIGFIESALPNEKINLTNVYSVNKWNFMLRNVYFGAVNDPDNGDEYGAKVVTDISATYNFADNLTFSLGANNLFDVYPDEVRPSGNYGRQFNYK